tara:strand:- start:5841 stop:6455 length:615 start_codon:yes stop_codon:yes gene_type:complete
MSYFVAYGLFLTAAAVAVQSEAGLDEWISLVTNGAMCVTALYAFKKERMDLTTIALFALCTSIVWHSSGKYKEIDGFVSRYLAYYAFGTTAFRPEIIGPAMIFITLLFTYEAQFDEMYAFIPLLVLLVVYKYKSITRRFVGALVVGVCAILCYRNARWHHMWHVLGAITVALTIEPLQRQPRFYVKNTPTKSPLSSLSVYSRHT